jgi:hypothetical protein
VSSPEVEIARQQWQAATRQIEGTRGDPRRHDRLVRQVEAVAAELRRRIGQTFTLAQLAGSYRGAEAWTLETIEQRDSGPGWERDIALVTDAAFDLYARGASDYAP